MSKDGSLGLSLSPFACHNGEIMQILAYYLSGQLGETEDQCPVPKYIFHGCPDISYACLWLSGTQF